MTAYKRPLFYFHPHLETIFPAILRTVNDVTYERERIHTPDGDFLDLDWIKNDHPKLAIISHGLEGNSTRPYVKGMARAFSTHGYDVIAWNYRGCSEEMNKALRFYHSGATGDLQVVIDHAISQGYSDICLIGFSLGGNITLKYLGERGSSVHPAITNAATFSVPLELHSSCIKISEPSNRIYANRFLRNLKEKVRRKAKLNPGLLDTSGLNKIKTLMSFDDRYTAPLHGFQGAVDYYHRCSALHFLDHISIPTLIVNAKNDPFLSPACYPDKLLAVHEHITFESPEFGGHVGFTDFNDNKLYWSEKRALAFTGVRGLF